ncbi:hypothetical protein LT493_08910 [Streptomyces tricolor]|nr:hypothetical protein [Streptomyces tricolor]
MELDTTSTDNIGGEISGSGTIEGTAWTDNEVSGSATGEVQAQQTLQNSTKGSATKENTSKSSQTNHSAPKDKGPNQDTTSEATSKVSSTVEDTVTGTAQMTEKGSTTGAFKRSLIHLALRGAFTAAFKGTWNHTWSMTNTETTEVTFTLKSNDEIQFGALNSMSRIVGDLHVDGTGKLVKDIAVDGPSTTNSSTVVAQTYSNPDKCQTLRPSGATAKAAGRPRRQAPEHHAARQRRPPQAHRDVRPAEGRHLAEDRVTPGPQGRPEPGPLRPPPTGWGAN